MGTRALGSWGVACALIAAACGASDDAGGGAMPSPSSGGAGAGMQAGMAGASGGANMPTAGMTGSAGSMAATGGAGATSSEGMGGAAGAGAGAMDGGADMPIAGADAGAQPPEPCAAAPDGVSAAAAEALEIVNAARLPAGAGCATMIPEINAAAQSHCDYYATNADDDACTANPHAEVMSCMGFTGEGPGDRMEAAGYMGRGSSEVMAFENDPAQAIAMWINSVWHRIPILDPWTTHLGYGGADSCDTIDFGSGTPAPDDTVVLWPYDGQTGLPTTFDGSHEGPEPPAPPTGWPSATPITVYAQELTVTEHVLTVDGESAPIDHVWLTSADSNFLRNGIMLYANAPFEANTTYRVKITGTYVGGALMREWTFTTGERNRF